jgi:hypothetical protein
LSPLLKYYAALASAAAIVVAAVLLLGALPSTAVVDVVAGVVLFLPCWFYLLFARCPLCGSELCPPRGILGFGFPARHCRDCRFDLMTSENSH